MLALAVPAVAQEPGLRQAARQAVERSADALVTVRLTIKTRMLHQGQERSGPEQTLEIAGTVLTSAGLIVVSDSSSNPAGLFSQMMPGGPSIETETSDVKIVLKDGREVPARFVLRDQDLDLAFLVPADHAAFTPVTLVKGAVPELLDPLVLVYPLGRTLGRGLAAAPTEVRSVVRKPRTFLVTGFVDGLQALGCPAFDGRARAVGLVVMRRAPSAAGAGGMRQLLEAMSPVVLTAEDVLDLAAQATSAAAKPVPVPSPVPSPPPPQ